MSVGVETAELIEPWIYASLTADSALMGMIGGRLFGAITPDEIDAMYVSVLMLSARDIRGVSIARFQVDAVYLVKAVTQGSSFDDVAAAAARISAVLDGFDGDYGGGHITCVRESIIGYPEVNSGQPYVHLGGQFRVRANKP